MDTNSEEYIEIISRLRKRRKQLGMSQRQLSEAIGMEQSAISKVENGDRMLSVIEFAHWAKALDFAPSLVLSGITTEE